MSGLNGIMDSSLSALLAAQLGMATTGHNIANAGTAGYSRQDMILSARRPSVLGYGSIGHGVEVMGIRRIQDEMLVANLRNQNARLGSFTATDAALRSIEGILGSVDNDHIGEAMNRFFAAWNDLAQPPFNAALKVNVVQSAQTLAAQLNDLDAALRGLEQDLTRTAKADVAELNRLLQEVADLNGQITAAEAGGHPANDLRDRRDLVLTEISTIAAVRTSERSDGSVDVVMGGRTMVSRSAVTLFDLADPIAAGPGSEVVVARGTGSPVHLSTGSLEASLAARTELVQRLRNDMNQVVRQLVTRVNAAHRQGDGGTGAVFFTGSTLADVAVNGQLIADANLVKTGRTGQPGDNGLALDIAALGNNLSGNVSVGEAYRAVISELAGDSGRTAFVLESQEGVVSSLEARLASVSGVSLDEEGARLVKYQNSYNAAAKVIQTVQEMYDTLLNMI